MKKVEAIITEFCKENLSRENIDFSIFKNPGYLYQQYSTKYTLNQFKGSLLEMLLEELFLGNGYRVERLGEGGQDGGCDLLIRYPQDNSIRFVLQAKNWTKHIDKYDIKKEYLKFTDNFKNKYNLNATHFCFVSWDYVREIKTQLTTELNIKVWDEQDIVQKLLHTYKPKHPHFPTIVLEPYQETSFQKIIDYWGNKKRCYVEHATGTGKTYIITKLIQHLLSQTKNRVLVLSPSIYINDRIFRLLEETISSKHISRTFKKDKRVCLLTYQYLMHNAEKLPKGMFSHVIMDEVHRAGAPEWHSRGLLNIIDSKISLVGLSATMQRYSGGIDVKEFLDNNCTGRLSLFEAMARGILPVGEYVYAVLDMESKIEELRDEVESKYNRAPVKKKHLLEKLDAREIKDYSIQNVIYKYYHSSKYQKIIAFCEDIEHTYEMQLLLIKTFLKFSKVKRFEVHSGWSRKENSEQLNKFSNTQPRKNEIFILTAVDMLNEGIDVSGIDSVMLFRKTKSPRIYFQQIGRSIRKHGTETPLIFDCVLNYQSVDIQFKKEAEKEFKSYHNKLEKLDFRDIETPKTIHISDEVENISEIVKYVEKKLNFYPMYEEAKWAVQHLGTISKSAYEKRYKEDPRLPSHPDGYYQNKGWIDWDDFLGREKKILYPTYEEAKLAVKRLVIKSETEYRKCYKKDPRLPSHPDGYYQQNGWSGWSSFFDKESRCFYPTYEEAREATRRLDIKSLTDYYTNKRYKEDPGLPCEPWITYKNVGWIDSDGFFGKERKYPTYEEAKLAVKRLGIKSENAYRKYHKKNPRLPSNPERFYKGKGWEDWSVFFGRERKVFYSRYEEAKLAVKHLGIMSGSAYTKRYKEDPRLPRNPDRYYQNKGWIDWDDFLGKEKKYPTYEEAKLAVKRLGIKSENAYRKYYKKDPRLPSNPNGFYKGKGWEDWSVFFGREKKYPTYEEAMQAVRSLSAKSSGEYFKRYKEDSKLPLRPDRTYKNKGWLDWDNYLGKTSNKK